MYDILSNFIYWLNSNILSFPGGITVLKKSLFLHTFSWDLNLFFCSKRMKVIQAIKDTIMFWSYFS